MHSGNDKDKFKVMFTNLQIFILKRTMHHTDLFITQFHFKATLLQQVDELLQSIIKQLKDAYALVVELENLIRPIQLELSELQEKIENTKLVEQISEEVELLKKKLSDHGCMMSMGACRRKGCILKS